MKMDAIGQTGDRLGLFLLRAFDKGCHFITAGKVESTNELTIDGMGDDHIDNSAALINDGVQFRLHPGRFMAAGDLTDNALEFTRDQVSVWRRHDLFPCGTQEGDVTNDDLPAHREFFRQAGGAHGLLCRAQPRQDRLTAFFCVHTLHLFHTAIIAAHPCRRKGRKSPANVACGHRWRYNEWVYDPLRKELSMKTLLRFLKQETVLCVAFVLALLSMIVVHPDAHYLSYPDYRTLALLFSLMIIVSGLQHLGAFDILGHTLIRKAASLRMLDAVMILLCFFSSMVITNDVALITFVPFTLLIFRMIDREARVLKLIVLETIAANLGSMATPIGNPQNLYLYSISGMSFADFAWAIWPYTALALVLLIASVRTVREEYLARRLPLMDETTALRVLLWRMTPYLVLLALCLLVVFRLLPYGPVLVIVALAVFFLDRGLYRQVDYGLLATFLCFFIFVGNVKRIPAVSALLVTLMNGRELASGILASQIISNVPAAILLSGFTQDFQTLLTAVNLGGLGTLIASLASLISFKFYSKAYPEQKGAFLKVFTFWNLSFLAALLLLAMVLP